MKKVCRKSFSVFLLLAMLLSIMQIGMATSVEAASSGFTISSKGVLTKYNGGSSNVTIPSTVTSIGDKAFYDCSYITSVTIPVTVTAIGKYAFGECTDLVKVTIPDSVTSVGNYAFSGCTSLESAVISKNIKSISFRMFYNCESLTKITIPDNVTTIGNYAFSGCSSLKSITVSSGVKSIGSKVFEDCDDLKIYGYKNTAIQTYATDDDITFSSLGIGKLTLDTKNYTLAPKKSYTIGANLVGNDLTLKVYSSNTTAAKVVKTSSSTSTSEYKVTSLKAGTAYIMFDVYRSGTRLTHASVKITVKSNASSSGSSSTQVSKF